MDCVLNVMDYAPPMMDFVLKMMDFLGHPQGARPAAAELPRVETIETKPQPPSRRVLFATVSWC